MRSIWNHFIHGDTLELRLEKEIFFVIMMLVIGAFLFHRIEWRDYFNALYFCIITLTSVGYGDLVPHTTPGKILTMIYALTALPLFVYTMSIIVEDRMKRWKK
jgi:potassium channel subfamily K